MKRPWISCSIAYILLAVASNFLFASSRQHTSLWLADAVAIAFLWLSPVAGRGWMLCLVAVANWGVNLAFGWGFGGSLVLALASLVNVSLSAHLLTKKSSNQNFSDNPLHLLWFILCGCMTAPLVAALIVQIGLPLMVDHSAELVWPAWYGSLATGSIAMLPIAVAALQPSDQPIWRRNPWLPTIAWIVVTSALSVLAILRFPFPFIFVLLPLLFISLGINFNTLLLLVLSSIMLTSYMAFLPGISMPVSAEGWSVLLIYLRLLASSLPSLVVGTALRKSQVREQRLLDTETELATANKELQTIIDNMPAMVGYWDAKLINRFGNNAYVTWFGMTPAQMRGKHIREVIGEERFSLNFPFMSAALQGETQMFERSIVGQDGVQRDSVASYVPDVRDGKVLGFYAFVNDITPVKQAYREQASAQELVKSVLDAASEFSIIATDTKGLIKLFSVGAERMLGYSATEMVGLQSPAILHLLTEIEARAAVLTVEFGEQISGFDVFVKRAGLGQAETNEWTYVHKNGTHIPIQLTVSATLDGAGNISGYLGIAKDIRDDLAVKETLRLASAKSEAASRAKSEFVANMSHELRTPMNAVLGIAQLLGASNLSFDQRQYVEMIRSSGQSLLSILNDILDFSKIEAGRMELSLTEFLFSDLLHSLAGTMSVNAGEKNLRLAIGVEPDVPLRVMGDALRIQQILINLTGNAIKFTEKGEVTVLLALADSDSDSDSDSEDEAVNICFKIRDTGIGITEEQQARLFTAFTQADSSTSRKFGGTGLGLTISKSLVDLMGGSIRLESEWGRGTEFIVTLPLRKSGQQFDERRQRHTLGDLRFLLVDEAGTSRDYLSKTITCWQWQVECVPTKQLALQAVSEAQKNGLPFDVILVDDHCITGNGETFVHKLRSIVAVVPPIFIMVNAFGRREIDRNELDAMVANVLAKPVTASSLFDSLHEVLVSRQKGGISDLLHARMQPIKHRLRGVRLLLAEDNFLNQIVARGMLEQSGAAIRIADNGKIALDILRESPYAFDLVLMDVQMPVMDGFTTARAIRQELGLDLPILAMTAGVTETERAQCIDAGMNDFIPKPVDLDQMVATIRRHLSTMPIELPEFDVSVEVVKDTEQSELSLFNPTTLSNLIEGNPAFLTTLATLLRKVIDAGLQPINDAQVAWEQGKGREAASILHGLRGNLGTLGASRFAATTQKIEDAIRGEENDIVVKLLEEARPELLATIAAANDWLQQHGEIESIESVATALDVTELQRLCTQLEQQNLDALDLYAALKPSLQTNSAGFDAFAMSSAMENLDFATARQMISGLIKDQFGVDPI